MSFANRISLFRALAVAVLCAAAAMPAAYAQGTLADYQRGQSLRTKTQGLVVNTPGTPIWIGESDHFWYPRTVKGGTEFVLVDAAAGSKKPAFDHEKLAGRPSTLRQGWPLHRAHPALRAASRLRRLLAEDVARQPRPRAS